MRKRISAILLALLILCSIRSVAAASAFREFADRLRNIDILSYSFGIEIGKLAQFSDERTEQLNRLLKHVGFSGFVSENQSKVDVRIQDDTLFTIYEERLPDKEIQLLSTDPEHLYIIPEENRLSTDRLNGISNDLEAFTTETQLYEFLGTCSELFRNLPSAFPDKTSENRIQVKYKDYGTAVKKSTISLSGEELKQYLEKSMKGSSPNQYQSLLEKLVFTNRQSFDLYFTEDERLIQIRYSGKIGITDEDIRNVRLEWKTCRKDSMEKDELVLRTPNSQGTRRNNLILNFLCEEKDGTEVFHWKAERDVLSEGLRTRTLAEAKLEQNEGRISGSLSNLEIVGNKQVQSEAVISLVGDAEPGYEGTLEINHKKDKIENDRLTLHFSLSPGNFGAVEALQPEIISLSAESYADIQEKTQAEIIRRILELPAADIQFLMEGIPEEQRTMIVGTGNE